MRVALDTTYALRARFSGTAIYLARIQEALRELDGVEGGVEVVPLANRRRRPPAGGGLGSVRNLVTDIWWTAAEMPRRARRGGADLLHHPLPAISPGAGIPQVITVLDLAFERLPAHFNRGYRTYARTTHRAAALAAGAVICISETTAGDVRSLWGVPPEKVVVAPLGPGQELAVADGPAPEPRHFLYVGDAEPRKDLGVLLEAYRRYRERAERPLELVLAGSVNTQGAGVRVEQRPPAERLSELYRDAAALVHPSLYEGFGLTPLEAMTVGTPVLAARAPGVSEVCGEAARYAPAGDPDAFATAMVELGSDPGLRSELSRLGRGRAARFSWRDCALQHVYAYSLALRP